jgi:peptidoglycan/xylan/chitin deacetylase (PgdA/CDA1 family)
MERINRREFLKRSLNIIGCGLAYPYIRTFEKFFFNFFGGEEEVEYVTDKNGVIWEGDTTRDIVLMTYDDGGREKDIRRILDSYEKFSFKTTFFITGEQLKRNMDLWAELVSSGHDLGFHGWDHECLTLLKKGKLEDQFLRFDPVMSEFKDKTGYKITFFRPPYGSYNQRVLDLAKERGLYTVMWGLESGGLDSVDKTTQRVVNGVKRGVIVLSHSIRWADIDSCELILKSFSDIGFEAVNLSDGLVKIKNKKTDTIFSSNGHLQFR